MHKISLSSNCWLKNKTSYLPSLHFPRMKHYSLYNRNCTCRVYLCTIGKVLWNQFSGSGSISFWDSRIRISYSELLHQVKIVRKTLISTVLWLLYEFLSLKNKVNKCTLKSNTPKKLTKQTYFLLASWRSLMKRAGLGAGFGSYVRGTEPWIRGIRSKMSQIRNTVKQRKKEKTV